MTPPTLSSDDEAMQAIFPEASGVKPRTTSQESDLEQAPRKHPDGERSKRPGADKNVDEGSPRNDGEGSIESGSDSDEDARSRRRDLGP